MLEKIINTILEFVSYFIQKPAEFKSTTIYTADEQDQISRSSFATEFKKKDLEKALKKAWHNRDFEIEMYWKRAAYFWTFIGATFLGYFALIGSRGYQETLIEKFHQVEIIIITIGLIFSMAWYYVNRGSKAWQVNWEAQIDELESLLGRPNYTTIFYNHKNKFYSVSRINQRVSLLVSLIWVLLYCAYLVRMYSHQLPVFIDFSKSELLNLTPPITFLMIVFSLGYLIIFARSNVFKTIDAVTRSDIYKQDNSIKKKDDRDKFFFKRTRKLRQ